MKAFMVLQMEKPLVYYWI